MQKHDESGLPFLAGMIQAADDLCGQRHYNRHSEDWDRGLNEVVELRTGAHGWREIQTALQAPNVMKRGRDARWNATMAGNRAASADRLADKLCKRFGIPTEYRGGDQLRARVFWDSFKLIHIEVGGYRFAWSVVAMGCAKSDDQETARDAIAFKQRLPLKFRDDGELMTIAAEAASAFNMMVYAYRAARQKALHN